MKKAINKVPTAAELNRMLARSPQEVDLFDKMDARNDWPVFRTGVPSITAAQISFRFESSKGLEASPALRGRACANVCALRLEAIIWRETLEAGMN